MHAHSLSDGWAVTARNGRPVSTFTFAERIFSVQVWFVAFLRKKTKRKGKMRRSLNALFLSIYLGGSPSFRIPMAVPGLIILLRSTVLRLREIDE